MSNFRILFIWYTTSLSVTE